MKKVISVILLALAPAIALASGGTHYDKANVNLADKASLQHGAQLFVNYCLSCHSAAFMRYNRMGKDLGLSDAQVKENMMFATDKIGSTMTIAMPTKDAKKWFGNPPPDLSVIARARGADYLYTYLRTFYIDEKRPFGVNNVVFPDVGMPHVLWELEGMKKPIYKTVVDHEGNKKEEIEGFEYVTKGKLSPQDYDKAALDLTSFLVYMGEPMQMQRKQMGVWVILFLVVFTLLAYALKKEYWRDIH